MKAGDKLPSVRELYERLKVNPNTVAKAYRDLEVMGYLYTRRGEGVFINKGIEAKCRQKCLEQLAQRLHEVAAEAKAAGVSAKAVKDMVGASYASDVEPYGTTPAPVLAVIKKK